MLRRLANDAWSEEQYQQCEELFRQAVAHVSALTIGTEEGEPVCFLGEEGQAH